MINYADLLAGEIIDFEIEILSGATEQMQKEAYDWIKRDFGK